MIPARVRSNASWLILFRLNPIDFENVYKDVIMLTAAKWNQILDDVFQGGISGAATVNENKKSKRYDHLDIFVEFDLFFKNF